MSNDQLDTLATAAASAEPLLGRLKNEPAKNLGSLPIPVMKRSSSNAPNFPRIPPVAPISTNNNASVNKPDWHYLLTVEERKLIRAKIKSAYETRTNTYEELLETCAAIEEEMLHFSAPSRLDYFKSGIQYEKRVSEKRKQLTEVCIELIDEKNEDSPTIPLKRSKTVS